MMAGEGAEKKIAVVGPVDPFRGGVAMHTTQLAQALRAHDGVDLRVVSFKHLYPKFLYPGESDRAPDGRPPEGLDVDYALDSVNPLTWMQTAQMLKRWGADHIVMPAWTFFVAPCLGMLAKSCRKSGARVTIVVHNIADHEASGVKSRLSNFQLCEADDYMAHGAAVAEELNRLRPGAAVTVSPCPIFSHYPSPTRHWPRRSGLELLFFGLVRPYKGLDLALEALARSARRDVRLSIVGEFWEDRKKYDALIAEHELGDIVEVVDRYVSDQEAAEYFNRADAVLIPYRSAPGTGVAPLAYHYSKPVIASDLPSLVEIIRDGESGWVFPANSVDALAALIKNLSAEDCAAMEDGIARMREEMSWERYVRRLIAEAP